MVSDFTHEPSFTMMPEFELCTVWVFMCYSANKYLCKQHGWTVYYVDLWLSRLHRYFTCCLLSLYCWYVQFSLVLKMAREWWNTHAVILGNRPITPYSILHGKSAIWCNKGACPKCLQCMSVVSAVMWCYKCTFQDDLVSFVSLVCSVRMWC